jgi:hypothetical protein
MNLRFLIFNLRFSEEEIFKYFLAQSQIKNRKLKIR